MLFPDLDEDSVFVHRADPKEQFGVYSAHSFELDGFTWPTAEHYFQAMKFVETNPEHSERIRQAATPKQARKLGRQRMKNLRKDWAKVKRVIMTRALYTKCRTYPEIGQALIDTNQAKIMEASQYDYYWGCGRDRRAENVYGKVLMDVRAKLLNEAENGG